MSSYANILRRLTIIQRRGCIELQHECTADGTSCLADWSLFRLREKACYAGTAVFGHARDGVYVRAGLEGGVEAEAVHLVEQTLGEDDRRAADFLKVGDVALDRLLEVFVGEDAVD